MEGKSNKSVDGSSSSCCRECCCTALLVKQSHGRQLEGLMRVDGGNSALHSCVYSADHRPGRRTFAWLPGLSFTTCPILVTRFEPHLRFSTASSFHCAFLLGRRGWALEGVAEDLLRSVGGGCQRAPTLWLAMVPMKVLRETSSVQEGENFT